MKTNKKGNNFYNQGSILEDDPQYQLISRILRMKTNKKGTNFYKQEY